MNCRIFVNESDIKKLSLNSHTNFYNDGNSTICNMVYFPYYFFPFRYFAKALYLKVPNIKVCRFFSLL